MAYFVLHGAGAGQPEACPHIRLDQSDAALVRRALRFTAPHGSGNHVLDVARLVKAKPRRA
jgi:hypothetical protein